VDLIPFNLILRIIKLGYYNIPTPYKIFKWSRTEKGYFTWIEKCGNKFIYKIYSNGVYRRPKHPINHWPHCKTYKEAQKNLLDELITILEEIKD